LAAKDTRNKQTRAHGALAGFPRLLGERLCLDYINTLEKMGREGPKDFLSGFAELAQWAQHIRLVSDDKVAAALEWGQHHLREATDLHGQGMYLRAGLTRIFTAVAHEGEPDPSDLRILRDEFCQPDAALTLQPGAEHFQWQWSQPDRVVEWLLWEVAASALQTLTMDDLHRIKECPGANDCGSIFYDTSRNGTRRWCSMEGCGSRVKMRRHYARHSPRATKFV
jgi:predicted RNA-binding Zn ribbon-like protein